MYEIGQIILSKKEHACGGREWTVVRTGADFKIKCNTCGRIIMVDKNKLDKMNTNK